MKLTKILLEQSTWTELPEADQQRFNSYNNDIKVAEYFRKQNPPKKVRKNAKGKWETIDASAAPTPTPTPSPVATSPSLTKFVGDYDGQGILPTFSIIESSGQLLLSTGIGQTSLVNVSGNQFKGYIGGVTYDLVFTESNGNITGGTAKIGPVTINFTKKTNTPSPSSTTSGIELPDFQDIKWMEVLSGTYDALKKAGYWVYEQGGKLWAAVKDGFHVKQEDLTTWKCVDNYLKSQGFYKLLDGSDGTKKWKYTPTNFKADGKSTFIVYFQDGRVEIRYQDGFKTVEGYTGKWECGTDDKSFKIVWDDGEEQIYGQFQPFGTGANQQSGGQGSNISNTTGAPKIQSFSQVCSAVLACPKIDDVKQGKKMYKVCMKCPEIQQFQEMSPLFKQIYFDLLQENGKKQQADQYFGPIMQAAIRNFQETIDKNKFLNEWGMIGKNTLDYLSKQPDLPQQQPTQQTSQPQTAQPQTTPKYELTQDKIVTNQTKF